MQAHTTLDIMPYYIRIPHPSFAFGRHALIYNVGGTSNVPWRGEAWTKGSNSEGYLRRAAPTMREVLDSFENPDSVFIFFSKQAAKDAFPDWFQ